MLGQPTLRLGDRIKRGILALLSHLCHFPLMRGRITLSEFVYRICRPDCTLVSIKVGCIPVHLDVSHIEERFVYFGAYERAEVRFLRCWLDEGDTTVDVGANIGYLSAVMAQAVKSSGKVYALEPDPTSYLKLQRVATGSGAIIRSFQLAVVDQRSPRCVRFFPDRIHPSWSTTVQAAAVCVEPILVRATSLDGFFVEQGLSRVNLIKIDVEGGEAAALRGVQGWLEGGGRPTILCELKSDLHPTLGEDTREIVDLVLRHRYRLYRFMERGRLCETSVQWIVEPRRTTNVVFVPEALTKRIGTRRLAA